MEARQNKDKLNQESKNKKILSKLTSILRESFLIFFVLMFFELLMFGFIVLIDKKEMPWEFFCYLNLYGIISCIIFSWIDRPIYRKRFYIGITICAAVVFTGSFFVENEALRMHSFFVLIGVSMGIGISKIVGAEVDSPKIIIRRK